MRAEAQILRALIQSAFVVRLAGLYESPLNSVLVTEYLAGGDLVTRYFSPPLHLVHSLCCQDGPARLLSHRAKVSDLHTAGEQEIIKTLKNRSNGITNAAIFFASINLFAHKPSTTFVNFSSPFGNKSH